MRSFSSYPLVGTIVTFDILVPYSEFAAKHTLLNHDGAGSYHLHATSTAYSRQKSSLTEPLIQGMEIDISKV